MNSAARQMALAGSAVGASVDRLVSTAMEASVEGSASAAGVVSAAASESAEGTEVEAVAMLRATSPLFAAAPEQAKHTQAVRNNFDKDGMALFLLLPGHLLPLHDPCRCRCNRNHAVPMRE